MQEMIYVLQGDGQMCNRIIYFVHALAVALEFKQDLKHFFADEILKFADGVPDAIPERRIVLRNHRGSKLINYALGRINCFDWLQRRYRECNAKRTTLLRNRNWMLPLVLANWNFRYPEGVAKHRERICAFLKVKPQFEIQPRKILESVRHGFDGVVAGVHIRRGDYRGFMNGAYYYDDRQYIHWMKEFESSSGRRVRFVIVSNEKIDETFFRSQGCDVIVASGLPQEDVVTLSLCDCIMGPPSTFSRWAAYYGDKPLMQLKGDNGVFAQIQ